MTVLNAHLKEIKHYLFGVLHQTFFWELDMTHLETRHRCFAHKFVKSVKSPQQYAQR